MLIVYIDVHSLLQLQRKQLLAIVVAKQKKKDYMIPAILNDVDRERMERKKCIKILQERVPTNRFYHKQKVNIN